MRIGDLARKAEVNIQTIRYYERKRLLRAPARTSAGYRSYLAVDLEHLRFIKWCQRLGFTLREIQELLPLHSAVARGGATDRQELRGLRDLLAGKKSDIEGRIVALRQLSRQLGKALETLSAAREPACPAARLNRSRPSRSSSQIRRS
jgi:DNA-binding transcriptional MerR regulator